MNRKGPLNNCHEVNSQGGCWVFRFPYVPASVLGTLHTQLHSVSHDTTRECQYLICFADTDTEAQSGGVNCLCHAAGKSQSEGLN